MNKEKEEVEIDLLELGKKLWNNKKFIIKCAIIGAIVGLVIAFSIPKEYTTTVTLTTNYNQSAKGGMGALASMAGINLGGNPSEDVLIPEIYPNVINSTYFIQQLLQIEVKPSGTEQTMTLYNYMKEEQHYPWWSYIISFPKTLLSLINTNNESSDETNKEYYISEENINIIEYLKNSYSINTDKKTGVTTLEISVQDPYISAYLADTLTTFLQSYIIEERTKKAKTDLDNSERLYITCQQEYFKKQEILATYTDGNRNVISAKYRANQERLQNEVNLAYSVYNQMAQQLQMARIKVQDNTPVFTIIQPAVETNKPSSPNKKLILGAFMIIAFTIACAWIIKKDEILNLKNDFSSL